jgi:hypothetical protein
VGKAGMRVIVLDNLISGRLVSDRAVGMQEGTPSIQASFDREVRGMVKRLVEVHGSASLVGAEVGVMYGINSISILSNLNISKLYLVDPYLCYEGSFYDAPGTNPVMQDALRLAVLNLIYYTDRVHWLHSPASEAWKCVDPLDFVYLDAGHSTAEVYEDCTLWWPVVKEGGYIGGHDVNLLSVREGVDMWAKGIGVTVTYRDSDWFVQKGVGV